LRKVSEREIAEDISSEVWMKILKNTTKFLKKDGASFKSWIYTIANNAVIDYYRTKKEKVDIEEIGEVGFHNDFGKNLDDKEKLAQVQEFLEKLKPLEKEVVILRVWDDLSYREIGEITGKTEANCKQIFKRTLEKIQANTVVPLLLILLLMI